MAGEMQIRARMDGEVANVKVLISHPMEPGNRKDAKTQALIPAHYITDIEIKLNATVVMTAQWGGAISKNPFLGFRVKGAKPGDFIKIYAVDNLGGKFERDAIVV